MGNKIDRQVKKRGRKIGGEKVTTRPCCARVASRTTAVTSTIFLPIRRGPINAHTRLPRSPGSSRLSRWAFEIKKDGIGWYSSLSLSLHQDVILLLLLLLLSTRRPLRRGPRRQTRWR